jgi:hypothetical protein
MAEDDASMERGSNQKDDTEHSKDRERSDDEK